MLIRKRLGFLTAIFLITLSGLQSIYAELEGMWTAEHPELGGLFFRVKSDGSCTYFLEKGTETTIHKGTWEEIPTGLKLNYDNGVTFSIGQLEPGLVDLRMEMAAGHDVGAGVVVSQAALLQSNMIGRMTVSPKGEDEEERTGYFGAWEGELLSGKKFFFKFNEDRTAGMTHSFTNPSDEDYVQVVGYWKKSGEKMEVVWNDGSFTLIETNGRRIEQTSFVAGDLLENAKGYTCRVLPIGEKDLPQDWMKSFDTNYVARMPIIVMRQIPVLKRFFRGEWIVGSDEKSNDSFRSIQLKRFGKASTNRFGGVKGDWYPGSDAVSIVWQNGVREQIRSIGNQFMVQSFNPDQPSSARPAKMEPLTPVDEDKMGYYLNRKKELLDPRRFARQFMKARERIDSKNKKEEPEEDE